MANCTSGCDGSIDNPQCTYAYWDKQHTDIEKSCSGQYANDINSLSNIWNNNNCGDVYSTILYTNANGLLVYNKCNLARVQTDTYNLFQTYLNLGYDFTGDVNSSEYNPLQFDIVSMCSDVRIPGGCDLALSYYCSSYTRDEIANDNVKASLCGCYAPPIYPDLNDSEQCDSMCILNTTTKKADPETGDLLICSNTVCVIDDTNINLVNTDTSTAFTQICPGCSAANPCTCTIGGSNIDDTINDAGGASVYQYCGPNSICYTVNNGVSTAVPCPPLSSFNIPAPSYSFPLLLAAIVIVMVIIIIIIFIAMRGGY